MARPHGWRRDEHFMPTAMLDLKLPRTSSATADEVREPHYHLGSTGLRRQDSLVGEAERRPKGRCWANQDLMFAWSISDGESNI